MMIRKFKYILIGSFAAFTFFSSACAIIFAQGYTIMVLDEVSEQFPFKPNGMNDRGVITGGKDRTDPYDIGHPFLWTKEDGLSEIDHLFPGGPYHPGDCKGIEYGDAYGIDINNSLIPIHPDVATLG